jgi:hypothetical protein
MSSDVGGGVLNGCSIAGTDVRNLMFMLEFYESIYSSTASANITLNDAAGFYQSASLKGGEDVSFSFGGRSGAPIRMNFKVGKLGDRTRAKDNLDMYMITCVPQEFIEQNQKEIVKAYKEKKVSEMAKDFHDEYVKGSNTLKKDLVTNEETEGKQNYFGTGRSPVTAIRWAGKEGKSSEAKASNYVYYQDRDGYHFRTIDKMLQGSVVEALSYSAQNIGAAGGDPSKKIIAFDQKNDLDQMDASFNGADSDHWYYYDPTTGKIGGGSKRKGAGDTTHTGKNTITEPEKESKDTARGEGFSFIIAPGASKSKTRDARDPKVAETKRTLHEHGAKSSAALQLDNLVMNLRVPGDIKYKPGIKLKLSIPANQEEGSLDKRSGDYLLTSVRHVLYRDDKDFKYECVLECKSDSHSKSAPSGTGGVA